jgi:hypothetical protein
VKITDPKFTERLLPALEYLISHDGAPIAQAALVFRGKGITRADLETWSDHFLRGRKLTPARLYEVKQQVGLLEPGHPSKPAQPPAASQSPAAVASAAAKVAAPAPVATGTKVGPTSDIGRWLDGQKIPVVGRANTYLVQVTPQIAEAWLAFNQGNRKPSRTKIRRFAAAMARGQWAQNGETVKFSVSGRLLDGQSRLMAIKEAGATVVLELRAGLPDIAQQSMDSGELRSGTHTLEMLGEKYPHVLAPALKMVFLLEQGILGGGALGEKAVRTRVVENAQLAPLLERHAGLKDSVGWVMTEGLSLSNIMQHSVASFFHYVFGTIDAELRDEFFAALLSGLNLTRQSPVYHLRERLLADRAKGLVLARRREHRALIIKAWNFTRGGEKISRLEFAKGDTFPEIAGIKIGKGGAS